MDEPIGNLKVANQELKEMIENTQEVQITDHSVPDSTDSKAEELATSQVGYKDLFDNMSNGCAYYKVLFDENGIPVDLQYTKINFAYAKNMGRPISELIGQRVTEVFPHLSEVNLQWIKTYMKVALHGQSVAFIQYFDYQDKWYSIFAYSPQCGYVVEISEDITESKKTEVQKSENQRQVALIEKVASLGAMADGVAHEINQPLQTLKIMVDGMIYWYDKGKETSIEKIIESCRHISVQVGYITAIVERMQDFVNRDWSELLEEVELNKMIKQALSMVQERLKIRGIQLRENICTVSPRVWGDIRRLEEIIIIILVNAMESLDCVDQVTKEIVITTSCVGENAVIEISNNGPAISDDIIGKIFEPFFSSTKSDAKLGMGLAIVKSVVDAHNGTIQASSFNQQVTFRIEFPLYVQ